MVDDTVVMEFRFLEAHTPEPGENAEFIKLQDGGWVMRTSSGKEVKVEPVNPHPHSR